MFWTVELQGVDGSNILVPCAVVFGEDAVGCCTDGPVVIVYQIVVGSAYVDCSITVASIDSVVLNGNVGDILIEDIRFVHLNLFYVNLHHTETSGEIDVFVVIINVVDGFVERGRLRVECTHVDHVVVQVEQVDIRVIIDDNEALGSIVP